MTKLPDFLIIGGMKCATSTLHEQLALQPGFFMSELKEPNFFSNDEIYARGMDWYASHFAAAPVDACCGESSTHYTKLPTYPETVARIVKHLPEVKLIYVMRHPIDRLISQYIHQWSEDEISTDINQAIDLHSELIDYSRYSWQLEPFFEAFGADRILPIFFERLFAYPQEELERICGFLGYTEEPKWQDLEAQNVSSERMRPSAWRDFLVEMPGLREIRQRLIPKEVRTWVRNLWTLKQRPQLEPQQVERLSAIFNEDLQVLGSWLGLDLSCQNFKAAVKANSASWVNPPMSVGRRS